MLAARFAFGKMAAAAPSGSAAFSRHPSTSSVELCSVTCRCAKCLAAAPVEMLVESSDDERSETSRAAAENSQHVSAARGGQKRAAKPPPEVGANTDAVGRKRPAAAARPIRARARPAAAEEVANAEPVAADEVADAEPAAADEAVDARPAADRNRPKFSAAHRRKPESRKEAYLLKDGKYLVGVTQMMHPRYEEIIAQIWDELSLDHLTPTGEATKLRARELMAEMH